MSAIVINVLVVALIGYILWAMIRPRYAVKIVLDPSGVRYHHGLASRQAGEVFAFLQKHVTPDGRVVIYGRRQPNGRLQLGFRGKIDSLARQRIRNFMVNVM